MDGTNSSDQMLRANLIRFASLLFNKMSDKYGGDTTVNELVIMNYGFVCHARGEDIRVTKAATDLDIPKSTVSRVLTGMRAKGFICEYPHPTDRRRRIFKLADSFLNRAHADMRQVLEWCAIPENALA